MSTRKRILLANDDGVQAKGLSAARETLLLAGLEVVTVAPHEPRSGTARSASFRKPVRIQHYGGTKESPIYAVNGTPTDAVRVAILSGILGSFDAVVSGINEGANLGDDATYSSTLGAAIEGALLGLPSIAASQQTRDGRFRLIDLTDYDFRVGATLLAYLVNRMIDARSEVPDRSVLNINAPGQPARSVELAHLDERDWHSGSVFEATGESAEERGWMVFGTHPERDPIFKMQKGSDSWALARGNAAVTPMNFKWNSPGALVRLQRWTHRAVTEANRKLFAAPPESTISVGQH